MRFLRQLALLSLLAGTAAQAQVYYPPNNSVGIAGSGDSGGKKLVKYLVEPVVVEAGKSSEIELHFRTTDKFHINSHKPLAAELIPTTLTMQTTPNAKLIKMDYPVGTNYAFDYGPKNKLSVYTGDFIVKIHATLAHSGSFTWNGSLRYQACDNAQCYPPQTLSIAVPITAKGPQITAQITAQQP
jgi:hypothetical protein